MKKIILTALAILLFATQGVHALVVSDPGAYTRMAQQIQEMQKAFEQAKKQLEEAQRIQRTLSGNLKRGIGSERDIRRIKGILEDLIPGFYQLSLPDGTKLDRRDTKNIIKMIDSVFLSQNALPTQAEVTEEQRQAYRQRTLKSSMTYSEVLLADMVETTEKLETLAAQIDETESLKDAQDLTNRYLQEMITGQTKIIILLAQMSRAEAAINYYGVGNDEQGTVRPATDEEYLDYLGKRGSKYWKPKKEAAQTMEELMGIE